MSKENEFDRIVHATSSGKLYIKTPDFFNQQKVQDMVTRLMESSVFKRIEKEKSRK